MPVITVKLKPGDPFVTRRFYGVPFDVTHEPQTRDVTDAVAETLKAKCLVIDPEATHTRRKRVEKIEEE